MVAAVALAYAQVPTSVVLRHLCTFGSKQGIHPPRVLSRRPATAVLGQNEHPYGLGFPVAVTTDPRGRVWITDSATASVHVFNLAGGGYREFKRCGDVPLQLPSGITSDPQGRVYLSDAGSGAIFVFNENGEYDHSLFKRGERPLERPGAMALSGNGRTIYVADPPRNVVVELNREGDIDGTIQLTPELSEPSAISVVDNQIYVLGSRQHRVESFSPNGTLQGELRWDGIQFPLGLAFDPVHRRFLVANSRWMIVQVFDDEGRNLGAFGQLGDGIDQVRRIDGVNVDPQGRAYVIDSRGGKVLVFEDAEHH